MSDEHPVYPPCRSLCELYNLWRCADSSRESLRVDDRILIVQHGLLSETTSFARFSQLLLACRRHSVTGVLPPMSTRSHRAVCSDDKAIYTMTQKKAERKRIRIAVKTQLRFRGVSCQVSSRDGHVPGSCLVTRRHETASKAPTYFPISLRRVCAELKPHEECGCSPRPGLKYVLSSLGSAPLFSM